MFPFPHQSYAWCHFKVRVCFFNSLCNQLSWAFYSICVYFRVFVCIGWWMKQLKMKWWGRRCFSIDASKGHKKPHKNRWSVTAFPCMKNCEVTPAAWLHWRRLAAGHNAADLHILRPSLFDMFIRHSMLSLCLEVTEVLWHPAACPSPLPQLALLYLGSRQLSPAWLMKPWKMNRVAKGLGVI